MVHRDSTSLQVRLDRLMARCWEARAAAATAIVYSGLVQREAAEVLRQNVEARERAAERRRQRAA